MTYYKRLPLLVNFLSILSFASSFDHLLREWPQVSNNLENRSEKVETFKPSRAGRWEYLSQIYQLESQMSTLRPYLWACEPNLLAEFDRLYESLKLFGARYEAECLDVNDWNSACHDYRQRNVQAADGLKKIIETMNECLSAHKRHSLIVPRASLAARFHSANNQERLEDYHMSYGAWLSATYERTDDWGASKSWSNHLKSLIDLNLRTTRTTGFNNLVNAHFQDIFGWNGRRQSWWVQLNANRWQNYVGVDDSPRYLDSLGAILNLGYPLWRIKWQSQFGSSIRKSQFGIYDGLGWSLLQEATLDDPQLASRSVFLKIEQRIKRGAALMPTWLALSGGVRFSGPLLWGGMGDLRLAMKQIQIQNSSTTVNPDLAFSYKSRKMRGLSWGSTAPSRRLFPTHFAVEFDVSFTQQETFFSSATTQLAASPAMIWYASHWRMPMRFSLLNQSHIALPGSSAKDWKVALALEPEIEVKKNLWLLGQVNFERFMMVYRDLNNSSYQAPPDLWHPKKSYENWAASLGVRYDF